MKKQIRILLAVMLVFLTACSAVNPLTGIWIMHTSYEDLAGSLPTEQELGNLAGYVDFGKLYLTSTYEFSEDGTYTIQSDVEQYIRDCRNLWIEGINAYYTDQIAQRNLDITVEEAWILDGLDAETLVDDEAIRAAFADLARSGNYKVRDGKLFLSAGKELRVDENVYTEFIVEGGTLTFLHAVGTEDGVNYPVKLTKAS